MVDRRLGTSQIILYERAFLHNKPTTKKKVRLPKLVIDEDLWRDLTSLSWYLSHGLQMRSLKVQAT